MPATVESHHCAACQRLVSKMAQSCPQCGLPFSQAASSWLAILLAVVVFLGATVSFVSAKYIMHETFALVLIVLGTQIILLSRRPRTIAGSIVIRRVETPTATTDQIESTAA